MPGVVGFTEEGARRIVDLVRDQERTATGPERHRRRWPVGVGSKPGVRVRDASSQSISASSAANLEFDTRDYPTTTNMHSTTVNNSRITIKAAGKYLVWFEGEISLGTTAPVANGSWSVTLLVNGSLAGAGQDCGPYSGEIPVGSGSVTYGGCMKFAVEDDFSADEYLQVEVRNRDTATAADVTSHVFGARKLA